MGSGRWDAGTYAATTSHKVSTGTTFGYTTSTRSAPSTSWKAHEDLDPKLVNKDGPFAGKNVRESRDNDEHPLSLPIIVGFDCTGSMGSVPRVLQTKLAELFGVILRKGYVEDPQVAISAYGDTHCDRVPLQFSQFESDNRIDDNLDKLFLEGGGGGNQGETATAVWYFAGKHTASDSMDKRGKKGYLFTIGDEVALSITKSQLTELVGDNDIEGDLTPEEAVRLAQKSYEVYHLIINNSTAEYQDSVKFYERLLGRNAIVLQDPAAVAETIAMIIGVAEGVVDLDDAAADLKKLGSSDAAVAAATNAVAKISDGVGGVASISRADHVHGLTDDTDEDEGLIKT